MLVWLGAYICNWLAIFLCLVVGFRPRFHSAWSRPLCNCLVKKINQGTDVLTHNCLSPLLALCVLTRLIIMTDCKNDHKIKIDVASWQSAFTPFDCKYLFDSRGLPWEDSWVITIGQTVAMENPTCIARLVQFKVVAVAMQPRFHHIQHLNEVTIIGQRCTVGHQCKMAELVECVLLL